VHPDSIQLANRLPRIRIRVRKQSRGRTKRRAVQHKAVLHLSTRAKRSQLWRSPIQRNRGSRRSRSWTRSGTGNLPSRPLRGRRYEQYAQSRQARERK